jgi:hypothetical protein
MDGFFWFPERSLQQLFSARSELRRRNTYLVFAGLPDILLFSLPVFWAWSVVERRRSTKR